MTFQSELARELFHKLPAEKQLLYARLEEMLANAGCFIHLIGVTCDGIRLEINVSVSEQPYGLTR